MVNLRNLLIENIEAWVNSQILQNYLVLGVIISMKVNQKLSYKS